MRFAHMADTHLGYRQYNLDQREDDLYSTFHEAVGKIIEKKCDFVVHSGDLFDEPRPHIKAIYEARKALDRLNIAGIPFFCIAGNHDILMRKNSLPPHRVYKAKEFLTPREPTREYNGILIAGLPYFSKIHRNALKDKLAELDKMAVDYDKSILLLHQGIDKYFNLEYELKFSDLPKNFDYIAMGHIHKRIEDKIEGTKVVYPGSHDIWRADEVNEYEKNGKGFYVVDTEKFEIEPVNLKGIRPFQKITLSKREDIEKIKYKILEKRPVLNIEIQAEPQEFHQIFQGLMARFGEKALHIDIKRRNVEESRIEFSNDKLELLELIDESMKEYKEDEITLTKELLNHLSRGEIQEALNFSESFYKNWNPGINKKEDGEEIQ